MEVSAYKAANGIFAKELEDELMKFTVKSKDHGVQGSLVKPTEEVKKNDSDVEVDITDCTKPTDNMPVPPDSQDLTESEGSSSFDESDSDFENVNASGNSEALSGLCGDAASAHDFDGFGDNFRRKKLTAHWRSFIQPIMWRCKWTELQIEKLQSLAQQCDSELEAHNKHKQIQLEESMLIDGVKSVPFSRTSAVNDLVKRKKRRMIEATTDVAEYMSRHNLFSYYENKKSSNEGASASNLPRISATQIVNVDDEFWANEGLSSFIAGDGDNCFEDMLRKIDFLQSQAGQLRIRVDKVISENADNIFSAEKLSLHTPFEASANGDIGAGTDVGTYIASQLMSEYNMTDELLPESAVTNHGDVVPNANANVDHARFARTYRNLKVLPSQPMANYTIQPAVRTAGCTVEDGALIDNRRVKEEMNNFDEVIINPTIQRPVAHKDDLGVPADDQPPLKKIRSIAKISAPRTKRKRGRKKSARRRTRRSTG